MGSTHRSYATRRSCDSGGSVFGISLFRWLFEMRICRTVYDLDDILPVPPLFDSYARHTGRVGCRKLRWKVFDSEKLW